MASAGILGRGGSGSEVGQNLWNRSEARVKTARSPAVVLLNFPPFFYFFFSALFCWWGEGGKKKYREKGEMKKGEKGGNGKEKEGK